MDTIDEIGKRYRERAEAAQRELSKVQRQIYRISTLRLLLFVAGAAGTIGFRHEGWAVAGGIALAALLPFVLLMKRHNRLFYRKDYLEKKITVNRQELAALDYDTSGFDGGEEFADPAHLYAYDLDVFGAHSLFQYINRTCTEPGKRRLADWLGRHLERKEEILARQAAVRELAPDLEFRQRFRILGLLHKGQAADETELKAWAATRSVFRSNGFLRTLPVAVACINSVCLLLAFAGWLPASVCGTVWAFFVAAGFAFTGKVSKLQAVYGKKLQILGTYASLLRLMESRPMQCALLKGITNEIGGEGRQASLAISRLSKLMDGLDQRNNVFMYVILNGLFFWELRQVMRIEAWKEQYARELPRWLDTLARMDALCSLATFAYNHPDYPYPTLLDKSDLQLSAAEDAPLSSEEKTRVSEENGVSSQEANGMPAPEEDALTAGKAPDADTRFMLRAKAMGHPLMHRDRCVRNDIDMAKRPFFIIITGANMAGKSTYLRTIGINYLLACTGVPVCAEEMTVYPARLVTSLRTSDSLPDNESYFFAELKRLKLIIDKLHTGEELFIILDEILKGTNSADKQKGSLALIRQFMALRANGIIATHDLLLGTLADLFPRNIRNGCFEADITGDELTFSYRLRPGVAQNMNACFLMKKMGIAVTD